MYCIYPDYRSYHIRSIIKKWFYYVKGSYFIRVWRPVKHAWRIAVRIWYSNIIINIIIFFNYLLFARATVKFFLMWNPLTKKKNIQLRLTTIVREVQYNSTVIIIIITSCVLEFVPLLMYNVIIIIFMYIHYTQVYDMLMRRFIS